MARNYDVNLHTLHKTAKAQGLNLTFDEWGIGIEVCGQKCKSNLSLVDVIREVLHPDRSGGTHETQGKNTG